MFENDLSNKRQTQQANDWARQCSVSAVSRKGKIKIQRGILSAQLGRSLSVNQRTRAISGTDEDAEKKEPASAAVSTVN